MSNSGSSYLPASVTPEGKGGISGKIEVLERKDVLQSGPSRSTSTMYEAEYELKQRLQQREQELVIFNVFIIKNTRNNRRLNLLLAKCESLLPASELEHLQGH